MQIRWLLMKPSDQHLHGLQKVHIRVRQDNDLHCITPYLVIFRLLFLKVIIIQDSCDIYAISTLDHATFSNEMQLI